MLTKGVYKNRDKRLPDALGRIWYEADINYSFGTEAVNEFSTPTMD